MTNEKQINDKITEGMIRHAQELLAAALARIEAQNDDEQHVDSESDIVW